jgi:predicted nucleotidyltransferase
MHPLIENNREAIASLCRLHGVRCLEAFGSILHDDFDAGRSDVDVLVEFEAQAADSFSNLLDLKQSLEALFQRSVDLVELRAIRNRRLRHYIEQSKSAIYAAA